MLVFAHHAFPAAAAYELGSAGVGFFFVLSGFILTHAYFQSFEVGLAWSPIWSFYAARLARIYPLHLIALAIAFALICWCAAPDAASRLSLAALLNGIFLLQAWTPEGFNYALNPPAWSISTEAFFYLAFPFVLWYLRRATNRITSRGIVAVIILVWLIQCTASLQLHRSDLVGFYALPPVRLLDFVVGILVALAFRKRQAPRPHHATVLEVIAIGFVITGIACLPIVPPGLRYSALLLPVWSIAIFTFANSAGFFSRRLLSHSVAVALGELSFAFYLIHSSMLEALRTLHFRSDYSATALAFAASLGLSAVLFTLWEQPLRVAVRRLLLPASENLATENSAVQ